MANKIINRISSDAWLLGIVAAVAAIAFGAGWLIGGRAGEEPVAVRVVQPTPRPLTDAVVAAFDAIDAAVSVGTNQPNFQASFRTLTEHYHRWARSAEPVGLASSAREALEEAYEDCSYISRVWMLKQRVLLGETKVDTGRDPEFEDLFGKVRASRYGVDKINGEGDWPSLVRLQIVMGRERTDSESDFVMIFIRAAMAHASERISAARTALR